MNTLTIIITVVYVLLAIGLITIVMLQEGKSAGLGSITGGSSESYWEK